MWGLIQIFVVAFLLSEASLHAKATGQYTPSGSPGTIHIDGGSTGDQAPIIILDGAGSIGTQQAGTFGQGGTSANIGVGNQIGDGSFGPAGPQRVGLNLGGIGQDINSGIGGIGDGSFGQAGPQRIGIGQGITSGIGANVVRFAQAGTGAVGIGNAGVFGQAGVGGPGISFGQSGIGGIGVRGAAIGSGQGGTRIIRAPVTPTVTKTVTLDHFVTLTDLAFHSVPVTLTDLVVRTTTATSRQVIRTPVDDRVALQTSVKIHPKTLTVTCTKYDYRIATEVSVDHVTVTHTSYIIKQMTYITTATQVLTYPSTMVRTIVRTQRTTVTDYRTITNTVHGYGAY